MTTISWPSIIYLLIGAVLIIVGRFLADPEAEGVYWLTNVLWGIGGGFLVIAYLSERRRAHEERQ